MSKRFYRQLASDSGVALVTVVGVLALMTIAALAAFWMSQQAVRDTTRTTSVNEAFQAANAGIDVVLAKIQSQGINSLPGSESATLDMGASYAVSVAPNGSQYRCVSVGTSADGIQQTVTVGFYYFNPWNMEVAGGGEASGSNGKLAGNTTVYGPLWCQSISDAKGNFGYYDGPLYVCGYDGTDETKGLLSFGGSAEIRTSSGSGMVQVWTSNPMSHAPGEGDYWERITDPLPDFRFPQASHDGMVSASQRGVWASGTSSSGTAISAFNAGPGLSIGATSPYLNRSRGSSSITWDGMTLTVNGTVFIDGPFVMNSDVHYEGNGTIWVNGNITMNGLFRPSTVSPTIGVMDAGHCVGLVSLGDLSVAGVSSNPDPGDPPSHAGAFLLGGNFYANGKVNLKGTVIANNIEMKNGAAGILSTDPSLMNYVPADLRNMTDSAVVQGKWTRR